MSRTHVIVTAEEVLRAEGPVFRYSFSLVGPDRSATQEVSLTQALEVVRQLGFDADFAFELLHDARSVSRLASRAPVGFYVDERVAEQFNDGYHLLSVHGKALWDALYEDRKAQEANPPCEICSEPVTKGFAGVCDECIDKYSAPRETPVA